jgi:succinate dehydrogenase hydrophobic anchor subunit
MRRGYRGVYQVVKNAWELKGSLFFFVFVECIRGERKAHCLEGRRVRHSSGGAVRRWWLFYTLSLTVALVWNERQQQKKEKLSFLYVLTFSFCARSTTMMMFFFFFCTTSAPLCSPRTCSSFGTASADNNNSKKKKKQINLCEWKDDIHTERCVRLCMCEYVCHPRVYTTTSLHILLLFLFLCVCPFKSTFHRHVLISWGHFFFVPLTSDVILFFFFWWTSAASFPFALLSSYPPLLFLVCSWATFRRSSVVYLYLLLSSSLCLSHSFKSHNKRPNVSTRKKKRNEPRQTLSALHTYIHIYMYFFFKYSFSFLAVNMTAVFGPCVCYLFSVFFFFLLLHGGVGVRVAIWQKCRVRSKQRRAIEKKKSICKYA